MDKAKSKNDLPNNFFLEMDVQNMDMGAVAVGATIYFGSAESDRQLKRLPQTIQLNISEAMRKKIR